MKKNQLKTRSSADAEIAIWRHCFLDYVSQMRCKTPCTFSIPHTFLQ